MTPGNGRRPGEDVDGSGSADGDRDDGDGRSGADESPSRSTDGPTSTIRRLEESTIQQIAAGEVVERPASAVKELVENSLDADASRVSVAVERGGIDGIRVRDDGVGMTADELELAVREHTTSKLDAGDALDAVETLGFRGEALYTIGAVSNLTVRSRPRGADGTAEGAQIRVEGGEPTAVEPAGCPPGTVVEVDDLFFNTPARRKFLKTDATEFAHVNTVVTQYALANPDVAVSLEHDGRELFATDGQGSLQSAVLSVYGRAVAESMVSVEHDGDTVAVDGLVSHPETNRSSREYLSTFVNGRYVTGGSLREAVLAAYGGQLASDRYPFAVLFLEVPPDAVDVNVHPRKTEVRFDDEAGVTDAVERAVRDALLESGLTRTTAPRGRGAPDETPVSPASPDEEVVGGAGTAHEAESDVERGDPRPARDRSIGADGRVDADPEAGSATDDRAEPSRDSVSASESDPESEPQAGPATAPNSTGERAPNSEPQTAPGPTTADADATDPGVRSSASDAAGDDAGSEHARPRRAEDAAGSGPSGDREPRPSPRRWQADAADESGVEAVDGNGAEGLASAIDPPTHQRTLDGTTTTDARSFDRLPRLRVLGQLHDTYLVAESPDGLVLIDQHAADERVNYERLRAQVRGDAPVQELAEPVALELTAREAALFEEYGDALADVGFRAERTGERTVAVHTVPAVFDAALDPSVLRDALGGFVSGEGAGGRRAVETVVDDLLADLACYPSVTGNTPLHEGSMFDLLSALDDCENPYACPHGRPVVVELGRDDLEARFERDYPGHAGRRQD